MAARLKLSKAMDSFVLSMSGVWSPATVLFYKNRLPRLITFLGDVEVDTVTTDQLRNWRVWLTEIDTKWGNGSSRPTVKGKLSPYTIHQYVRSVKRFFAWCFEEGILARDPARRFEKPVLPKRMVKGISKIDRDRILKEAEGNPRDKVIVYFLADTGCRVGGLSSLQINDIDLENHRAVIREKGRGGWGKERYAFFTEPTAQAIQDYLSVRPDAPGITTLLVGWTTRDGARHLCSFGTDAIRIRLKHLAKAIGGIEKSNPHAFRHGAIRAWLNNGMPLSEVSVLAGHSTVTVTADVYGVVSEAQLQADHTRFTWMS